MAMSLVAAALRSLLCSELIACSCPLRPPTSREYTVSMRPSDSEKDSKHSPSAPPARTRLLKATRMTDARTSCCCCCWPAPPCEKEHGAIAIECSSPIENGLSTSSSKECSERGERTSRI